MGYGFPAAIGAQFGRPGTPVWAIVGDGGFQMTLCELATAAIHKLPVKVLIINNNYLGMVRQWQELFFDNRLSGVERTGRTDRPHRRGRSPDQCGPPTFQDARPLIAICAWRARSHHAIAAERACWQHPAVAGLASCVSSRHGIP
jgi:hypothetical protein